MSVTGEFQRYLEALLDRMDNLDETTGEGASQSCLNRLREELKASRPGPTTAISESARGVLEALEKHNLAGGEANPCTCPAHLGHETGASARDLGEISRIILGRTA